MADDASCHLSCYTLTHASIWHRYEDMALQRQWGHVTSLVTWLFDSRRSTSYGWSVVTMRLSTSTVMEIWPFEVLPGRLFQQQRSVVGRSKILHWSLRYVRNVPREE